MPARGLALRPLSMPVSSTGTRFVVITWPTYKDTEPNTWRELEGFARGKKHAREKRARHIGPVSLRKIIHSLIEINVVVSIIRQWWLQRTATRPHLFRETLNVEKPKQHSVRCFWIQTTRCFEFKIHHSARLKKRKQIIILE